MRHEAFRKMASEVHHIVAVCNWVYELLLRNSVSASKVSISRHGISWTPDQTIAPIASCEADDEVRLVFVGRLSPTKGLHILINALRMVPTLKISLHNYGVVQSSADGDYQKEVSTLASDDPRI